MEAQPREIRRYRTVDGKVPFDEWLESLPDRQARAKIKARIRRAKEFGHLGDWKRLKNSEISELRFKGNRFGYIRVYYGEDSEGLWLLGGGDKDTQTRDILKAEQYWADHGKRKGASQ
ncbi:MAG: type II toxin-antitoxin system RelE/ParE family toxin [Lyngbya sp. HA4199-MV5]|jgi:putative addiction module killer protein|nr:type II toxin-antitoxin system RelE/ParE family toxin [Lyngbya sp. HA4199-MV5]